MLRRLRMLLRDIAAAPGPSEQRETPDDIEARARALLKAGDFAAAGRAAAEIDWPPKRCALEIELAKAAFAAGNAQWRALASATTETARRLEEEDPWHDAASAEPLRRYWAVRALGELHEADGNPARAVGVLALSSRTSDVLFEMEAIYRRAASRATLRAALTTELERLRRGLADGSVPAADAPEHLRRPEGVRRAMARLWAVLGEEGEARRDLGALPGDPVLAWRELREQISEIPETERAPAPEDDGDAIDFRVVPLEEIAAAIAAGDLALAARLAECHIDDRRRQAYRRDVARACLDRGDVAAAKTVQARVEDRGIARALAGEIARVGAGGSPTPPTGEVLAVVIDNDQPGNPEKQRHVRGFHDHDHALAWAERRVRASLERYRRDASASPDAVRAAWERGGEDVRVDGHRVGAARIADFAARPASAEEMDFEALAPRLF